MSRIPEFVLRHTVTLRTLVAASARGGDTFADPINRRAQVDERTSLRLDARPDSPTAGTEIPMQVQVIMQLEHYLEPGSLIEWRGRPLVVANASRHEHDFGPSNAELWCVG